jgi:hypothetical protein
MKERELYFLNHLFLLNNVRQQCLIMSGQQTCLYLPLNASISIKLVPKSWFNKVLFPAQNKKKYDGNKSQGNRY